MAGGDASPLAPVIVIAVLVICTALTDLRHPGSARRQWAFATNPRAMAASATVAAATLLLGGTRYGWAAVAWALLTGALAASSPAAAPQTPQPIRTRSSLCRSDSSARSWLPSEHL